MPPLVEHFQLRSMEPPRNGDMVSSVHVSERERVHPRAPSHPLTPYLRTALYDYDAQGEDELSLRKGQIVEVLSEDAKISGDEGWWTGKIGDKVSPHISIGLLLKAVVRKLDEGLTKILVKDS